MKLQYSLTDIPILWLTVSLPFTAAEVTNNKVKIDVRDDYRLWNDESATSELLFFSRSNNEIGVMLLLEYSAIGPERRQIRMALNQEALTRLKKSDDERFGFEIDLGDFEFEEASE